MIYTDLHIHLLCGVDDRAKNEEQMREIVDAAYADGTRAICATLKKKSVREIFSEETDDKKTQTEHYLLK